MIRGCPGGHAAARRGEAAVEKADQHRDRDRARGALDLFKESV